MSIWTSVPDVPLRASQLDGAPDEPDTLDVDVAYAPMHDWRIRLGLWSDNFERKDGGIDREIYLTDEAALALAMRLKEAVERNRSKDPP